MEPEENVQDACSLPLLMDMQMSMFWLAKVQVPANVPGTIPIIILLCSRVNTNNAVLTVFLNCANFTSLSAPVWFLSGDCMLSTDVNGNGMWVNWWGREASKQPVLLLIKGKILQVAAWLSQECYGQRQKIHKEGWMILSGWGLVHCVDFISGSVSNVTNVLREKERVRGKGRLYWVLDMGIFPLCGLSYPLPEVPGKGTNGDPSHSSS